MKARIFIKMVVMLITMVSMTACTNNENPVDIPEDNKIIGTWSLLGFGTIGENKYQEVNDKLEKWWLDKRFTLAFMGDGTLKGYTWANEVLGEYKIYGNIIEFSNLRTTLIEEQYDGEKYYNALLSVTHFEIRDDQLFLYYNEGQNYLLFDNVTTHAVAQTYYYYGHYNSDEKTPLILNENKVCVYIYKENKDVNERIRSNVQVLNSIKDDIFDGYIVSRTDYEKLTSRDFWEEDAKSVIVTASYFAENDKEVYATPYLNVKLKKEEDIDLLTSYAEKYGLKIDMNLPLMPLWYILHVTPESEKSQLQIANELYESGDFAASVPDLAGGIGPDQTSVRSITTATTEESSEIYDLQGRRLSTIPQKGVYIQNGKKKLVK